MSKYIREPGASLPIVGEYDVIVSGGGIAGIAAALSASRTGARTLLIEREFALGGLATLGLVTIYLPLDDGCGKQVSFGIAEELLRLSIKHGHEARYPAAWLDRNDPEERKSAPRFEVQYNAAVFSILAEQLLRENGVDILFGATVASVIRDGDRITHLVIEGKGGREAYAANAFVDATGDADLAARAELATAVYAPRNVLAAWYYHTEEGKYRLNPHGYAEDPSIPAEEQNFLTSTRYTGLDTREISEMVSLSHDSLLCDFLKGGAVSAEHALATIATIPQLRMTRRIIGAATMTEADNRKACETSVGIFSNWRRRGPAYELPLGALHSPALTNLFFAGRCISADDSLWDITRVIPVCAVSGEAAGIAASRVSDTGSLSYPEVSGILSSRNVPLHLQEL